MLRLCFARQLSQGRLAVCNAQQLRAYAAGAVAVKLLEPDWEAFNALVSSDEGKREVSSLRSAFNETKKKLETMGTGSTEVDWNKFKDGVDPAILELFRKSFANLKVPKFDPSQQLKKVDAEFEPLLQSATELEAFSKKREQEIQAEIATIDKESKLMEKRTVEDELQSDQKLAKEVDEEITKGSYY